MGTRKEELIYQRRIKYLAESIEPLLNGLINGINNLIREIQIDRQIRNAFEYNEVAEESPDVDLDGVRDEGEEEANLEQPPAKQVPVAEDL